MNAEKTSGPPKPRSTKTTTRKRAVSSRAASVAGKDAKRRLAETEQEIADPAAMTVETEKTPAPRRSATRRQKAAPKEGAAESASNPAVPEPKRGRARKSSSAATTDEEVAPAKKASPARKRTDRTAKAAVKDKAEPGDAAENPPPAENSRDALEAGAEKPKRRAPRRKNAEKAESASASSFAVESAAETPAPQAAATDTDPQGAKAPLPLFSSLGLSDPIMRAIGDMGYEHPTPIQAQAIPHIIDGRDVLGVAQTGTGKTASFTLPLLEKLSKSRARARMPRSLILEPTRELALQVAENFELYGKYLRLTHALLIGGSSMAEQRDLLNRGVDVLIATPGRLLDLFDRGGLLLTQTDTLVIDEADRMLDMGFIPDIERIVSLLPGHRQTLFFSATMAPEIRKLADAFLTFPKEITVARQSSVASTITENLILVDAREKLRALSTLLRHQDVQSAIVFCNRKRDVDTLQRALSRQGFAVGHLHGDLTQSLRFETLDRFRSGELKILVCSDVAARGIDIGGLSHVFNYDLPFNAEDYVHRIGRTGRAGKEGHAFSLATPQERNLLDAIEALTGKAIVLTEVKNVRSAEWETGDAPAPRSEPGRKASSRRSSAPRKKTDSPQKPEKPLQDRSAARPPLPEKDSAQTGFGENVPAFMLVRPNVRRPTDGSGD